MALVFNRQAGLDVIASKVARGIEHGLDTIEAKAVENAPSRAGTDRSRTGQGGRKRGLKAIQEETGQRLSPRVRRRMVRDANRNRGAIGEITGLKSSIASRRRDENAAIRRGESPLTANDISRGTNRGLSGSFVIRYVGPGGHEAPPNQVGMSGGKLRRAAVAGGNLKSKIHRTDVEISGSTVSGSVISGAPYSVFVEFGFMHVGGVRIPANPFMRAAIEDWVTGWRKSFKG